MEHEEIINEINIWVSGYKCAIIAKAKYFFLNFQIFIIMFW